jgi:glutaredoxin 3
MKDVVIYTKSWCGYCTRAKALLSRKEADFTEIEISGDDELRDQMIERAGSRHTVPQIFIGNTHVGGCDDLYELESKNERRRARRSWTGGAIAGRGSSAPLCRLSGPPSIPPASRVIWAACECLPPSTA